MSGRCQCLVQLKGQRGSARRACWGRVSNVYVGRGATVVAGRSCEGRRLQRQRERATGGGGRRRGFGRAREMRRFQVGQAEALDWPMGGSGIAAGPARMQIKMALAPPVSQRFWTAQRRRRVHGCRGSVCGIHGTASCCEHAHTWCRLSLSWVALGVGVGVG